MSEVSSLVQIDEEEIENIKAIFYRLQKRMKYGLPSGLPIFIYEMGLSDRQLCLRITDHLFFEDDAYSTNQIIEAIAEDLDLKNYILENFPAYFNEKLERMIVSVIPF